MRFRLKSAVYAGVGITGLLYLITVNLQHIEQLIRTQGSKKITVLSNRGLIPDSVNNGYIQNDNLAANDDVSSNMTYELQRIMEQIKHWNNDDRQVILKPKSSNTDPTQLVFPDKHQKWKDRITNQINYIPNGYKTDGNLKIIYLPSGTNGMPLEQKKFLSDKCAVNRCWLTMDSSYKQKADAVIFQNEYWTGTHPRNQNQVWILWLLESAANSMPLGAFGSNINWTATYRSDSTIVTPYEKFVHFDNFTRLPSRPLRNYAEGKSKMAAWFVSNCNAVNKRMEYVRDLQNYIDVDIYGSCGPNKCDRYDKEKCNDLLNKDYKFYLAFENSNCMYYITEKFYWNALWNDVVPVVMGARKQDYAAVSPPNSFIHVEDFPNAKALADYLLKLDREPELYNKYFLWKGTGQFIDTKFWCRVCSMLHGVDETPTLRWYKSVEKWWRNDKTCTRNRWDDKTDWIRKHEWSDMGFGYI